jgi:hypothetical protein
MSNSIKIHRPINSRYAFEADEFATRTKIYEAVIPQSFKMDHVRIGEEVAEYVFHILNAPEEMLSEEEINIANDFRAPGNYSLSTGDIVEVDGVRFLCESFGWKEVA